MDQLQGCSGVFVVTCRCFERSIRGLACYPNNPFRGFEAEPSRGLLQNSRLFELEGKIMLMLLPLLLVGSCAAAAADDKVKLQFFGEAL